MANKAWYQYPRIDNYGGKEPFGGFPKPDSNVQCPDGTAITALGSGQVSAVVPNGSDAWGATVTVRLDVPVNSIATHEAYLHLAANPPVRVGQRVSVGTLLGYSGGANAAGAQKAPVGFALYNGDQYGHGPSWSQYLGNPALNPVPVLDAFAGGGGGTGGFTLFSQGQGFSDGGITGAAKAAAVVIAPNAAVTDLLQGLDQGLRLTNPFLINSPQITIAGVTFSDPVAWWGQLGQNMVDDATAFTVRFMFFLLAMLVFYKVFSAFIDFGAIGQSVMSGVGTVAKGAALLA